MTRQCGTSSRRRSGSTSLPDELTHIDEAGSARMVDVGDKQVTDRRALARAVVRMAPETAAALRRGDAPKGDVVGTARIAGIQAAKRTADLIPLCHPLPLSFVDVRAELGGDRVTLTAEARTSAQTGVEMEAMTAASAAVLTVSTTLARGEGEDRSGQALVDLCRAAGLDATREVVPDDREAIAAAL